MTDVRDFTEEELQQINQKRRKGGMRQLSKGDARRAREQHEAGDDGSDLMTFLLLFTDYDRGSGGHSPSQSDDAPARQSTDWSQPSSGSGYSSDTGGSSDSGGSSSGGDSGGGGGGSD